MLLVPLLAVAQLDNVWVFGNQAGLDFNSGSPLAVSSQINGREASASVCDASGQLLFYTEGTFVWDQNGNLMPNGTDLTPIPFFSSGGIMISPTISTTQGAQIIPDPADPQQYYIFSLTAQETGTNSGRLYYSKVNMGLNGGLGDVIPGQKGILLDTFLFEKMSAVAGNRCNYWLMVCSQDLVFKAHEVTAAGVAPAPILSSVAIGLSGANFVVGSLVFSPDRYKMAATQSMGSVGINGASLYDFDPATGTVSNAISLQPLYGGGYGICFSPDNTKLYLNETTDSLYQYDLSIYTAAAIQASKIGVGMHGNYSQIKAGPDGKLYLVDGGSFPSVSLAAVNNPNIAGLGCGFVSGAVSLLPGSANHIGLPNPIPLLLRDTSITVHDAMAPCFSVNATIAAGTDGGFNYEWNTGATTPQLDVAAAGTYWVRYNMPPCDEYIDTIRFTLPYGVLPTITTVPACSGVNNGKAWAATFAGDTVYYHYTWLNGTGDTVSVTDTLHQAMAGNYMLYIHTVSCDTLLEVTVPEIVDSVAFSVSDTLACAGDLIDFQNTSGAHYTTFTWDFDDDQTGTVMNPAHSYDQSGSYRVRLTGAGARCADTAYMELIIDDPGALMFTADRKRICTGEYISFLPDTNTTMTRLDWSFGDGAYTNQTTSGVLQHAYDQAGNFSVMLTAHYRACPSTSVSDTVHVFPMPVVNLGGDTSLCLEGHAVVLRNLATTPDEPYQYLWNTGDTTAGLRVLQPGTYSLSIIAATLGCTSTDEIEVTKDCYTDIPNAFTPNGDGDNDYFFPRTELSKSVQHFKMQVMNRWGQLVFETGRIDGRGWDGRFNDKEQPVGVYIYLIDVVYNNGQQEKYTGNVTLIR